MGYYKKYFRSTIWCGEIILDCSQKYDTYEEAKANTNAVYPDIDWEEYNEDGFFVGCSYH